MTAQKPCAAVVLVPPADRVVVAQPLEGRVGTPVVYASGSVMSASAGPRSTSMRSLSAGRLAGWCRSRVVPAFQLVPTSRQ